MRRSRPTRRRAASGLKHPLNVAQSTAALVLLRTTAYGRALRAARDSAGHGPAPLATRGLLKRWLWFGGIDALARVQPAHVAA
jgi:hypothetical protein